VISWGESRPKSSKPAQVFCDWLAATLVLRQMALASRKARPDLYERVQTADSDITVDEEVDEDEFEQESVEIVDDQGNAIEQIDLSQ
jgi:hypothetical protein